MDVDARDLDHAVVPAPHAARPRLAGVSRQARAHMRSGALTPSSPRPLARTWRTASLSHRRVRCVSVTSSSGYGRTRCDFCWYHVW
ncbi:Uncharacterised protein [Mycobacteroides abscessus]|nr:Uncharacterised protein [Mycobacteroides abscessus]